MKSPRTDAIWNVMREASSIRYSRTSMLRLHKSLEWLGLLPEEISKVMRNCDYWDAMDQPYPQYRAKVKS